MELWDIILFGGVGYCCWMVKANQLMLSKLYRKEFGEGH